MGVEQRLNPLTPRAKMPLFVPGKRSSSLAAKPIAGGVPDFNHGKTGIQQREPGHVKPKKHNAWDMLAL